PPESTAQLQTLMAEEYAGISKDSVFNQVPSAIPYCFAAEKQKEGLATVYRPKELPAASRCIVFLHGYGGSLLWSLHVLVEAFPNHLIICPAYGISAGEVPARYVEEALAAVEHQLGLKIQKPVLMGLSAGGFGAAR